MTVPISASLQVAQPAPLPVPPQTARFQEKRDTLLAAAARHFNQQGVKGATLGDIAASVGLVTTSLTYYYRKKEDLATACFLRAIVAHESLALAAADAPTVAARVARFFSLHADLLAAIERGEQAPLMVFSDIRALPDAQASTVFAAYTDMFRRVRALLSGPETAGLDRDDLNARAHLMLSAAHRVRAWIDQHEVDEYPRVARRVADLLLHGLAPPGASWPGEQGAGGHFRGSTLKILERGVRQAALQLDLAREALGQV